MQHQRGGRIGGGGRFVDHHQLTACMIAQKPGSRIHGQAGAAHDQKIGLLLAFTDRPREVEDPWFTGRFGYVFDEISEGCAALLSQLTQGK